jgi:hypothetical protein
MLTWCSSQVHTLQLERLQTLLKAKADIELRICQSMETVEAAYIDTTRVLITVAEDRVKDLKENLAESGRTK